MDDATLFGAAAAVSALVGTALAVWSHIASNRSAADKASRECHEQLLATRLEAEKLSEELHKLRMERDRD